MKRIAKKSVQYSLSLHIKELIQQKLVLLYVEYIFKSMRSCQVVYCFADQHKVIKAEVLD